MCVIKAQYFLGTESTKRKLDLTLRYKLKSINALDTIRKKGKRAPLEN